MEKADSHLKSNNDFRNLDTEQRILMRLEKFSIPHGRSAEEALVSLKEKITRDEKMRITDRRGISRAIYLAVSVAAGLLLLFGIRQVLFKPGEERIIAEQGSVKEYILPDGTRVVLNAGSTVRLNEKHFSRKRNIMLTGEAFFEVVKGSPFTISTKKGNITVLGTSFNVFARGESFKVSCLSGKVKVDAVKSSVLLIPGESAELSGNELKYYKENFPERTNSWINGEFFYENACLKDVFNEIERQFGVKFDIENIENEYFTGSFTNKDLRSALDIVCIPMEMNYEIGKNNKIFVTKIIK